MTGQKCSKSVSEEGFEPTPPFGDQNTQSVIHGKEIILESGALDRSAIMTLAQIKLK